MIVHVITFDGREATVVLAAGEEFLFCMANPEAKFAFLATKTGFTGFEEIERYWTE